MQTHLHTNTYKATNVSCVRNPFIIMLLSLSLSLDNYTAMELETGQKVYEWNGIFVMAYATLADTHTWSICERTRPRTTTSTAVKSNVINRIFFFFLENFE